VFDRCDRCVVVGVPASSDCSHSALPNARLSGATNKHRYVLAAQSATLRTALSAIPALPLIHFNPRGVLVLSPPSHATLKEKDRGERERLVEGAKVLDGVVDGANVVASGSGSGGGAGSGSGAGAPGGSAPGPLARRRAKVRGPNPLSMKKAKTGDKGPKRPLEEGDGDGETGKKRKRKRRKGEVAEAIEDLAAVRAAMAEEV